MNTRALVALVALLAVLAAGCSVERLPVPSTAPPSRASAMPATEPPPTPSPVETPWAIRFDAPPDASTASVLGEEAGSILVATVQWLPRHPNFAISSGDFTGQPATLRLTVVRPGGGRRDVGALRLPTGMANGALGPRGYVAVTVDRWVNIAGQADLIHEIVVMDLRDLLGPEVARAAADSRASFSWSPSGELAFVPPRAEDARAVFDPVTSTERVVQTDLDCCVRLEWTADGTAWLATEPCNVPSGQCPGLVDSEIGSFRRTDELPLPYPIWNGAYARELDRRGWVLSGIAEFDDMGKATAAGQVASRPATLELTFDDPRATIWWDSRIDEDWWQWQGWDTDGEGILVVRSTDRANLELTRYGEPREPETIAVLDLGPVDPTSVSVVEVRDVSGRGKPDIVLQQLGEGPTWWFSGLSGRVIELGANIRTADTLETTVVLGWIED